MDFSCWRLTLFGRNIVSVKIFDEVTIWGEDSDESATGDNFILLQQDDNDTLALSRLTIFDDNTVDGDSDLERSDVNLTLNMFHTPFSIPMLDIEASLNSNQFSEGSD